MRVSIGSDHRGVRIKAKLLMTLHACGHEVHDHGTHDDQSVDYPDFAAAVCQEVATGHCERGILI